MPAPMATKPPKSALTHQGARASLQNSAAMGKEIPHQNSVKAHRPQWLLVSGFCGESSGAFASRPDNSRHSIQPAAKPTPVKTSANGKRKICNRQRMDGSTRASEGCAGLTQTVMRRPCCCAWCSV